MTDDHETEVIPALSQKQLEALPLLASGQSYREVAANIGVAQGTIRNWVSQVPEFKAELRMRQRALYLEAHSRLQALSDAATQALHDVLVAPETSARDRVTAARTVLSHVHDRNTNHTIQSTKDAAAMIASILNDAELSE